MRKPYSTSGGSRSILLPMPEPWRSPDSGCEWGLHRRQKWSQLDDWDRMSVAADSVLVSADKGRLRVLVHRRRAKPYLNKWALPGVFIDYRESGEDAAIRALKNKCHFGFDGYLEHLDWSWEAGRDPRGWIGTCAYLALSERSSVERAVEGFDDVALADVSVPWPGEYGGPVEVFRDGQHIPLAFDHEQLVGLAVKRLRAKLLYTGVALELMPEMFTLRRLQDAFEAILGAEMSDTTFRRLVVDNLRLIEPTGSEARDVPHRPPVLYRRAER